MATGDWEREAENWIAWARTPDHDSYSLYRDAFFELVPDPGRATLEVGCGEGRVSRDLIARGHRVTDAGQFSQRAADAAFVIDGSYLDDHLPWYYGENLRTRWSAHAIPQLPAFA